VVERYRLLGYEATKEALKRAEKEWPRAALSIPNSRGKGLPLEIHGGGSRRLHHAVTGYDDI
jgi:hypothetical protein